MFDDPRFNDKKIEDKPLPLDQKKETQENKDIAQVKPLDVQVAPAQEEQYMSHPEVTKKKKTWKIKFLIVAVIILIVIVTIGYFGYQFYMDYSKNYEIENEDKDETLIAVEEDNVVAVDLLEEVSELEESIDETVDTDADGLTDLEEENLGTSKNLFDTDQDGLNDYLEVKVYETNPLVRDTDGDGYLDEEEIKNGYNPKGPGKLLNL